MYIIVIGLFEKLIICILHIAPIKQRFMYETDQYRRGTFLP